jgi:putative methionine-R-sulfoxide reductase with GAF domain
VGVLDLDSPSLARFGDAEARAMERIVELYVSGSDSGT